MNATEKLLFEKLTADRRENARVLEKTSMRGVEKSVVEKYSDEAHFIYELLQNADDAGATSARFVLYPHRLLFVHNGTRYFSVTDLDTEEEDTKMGTLGDLNAITSIANSNKTEASIGKFGVGFKAVFQYTTTPYIYDPHIAFKIERFIVPVLLEDDCEERKERETAFVFPFDHPERDAKEAYEDISHKLRNLVFPTLFLKNLKTITYQIDSVFGTYQKGVKKKKEFDDTSAELLELMNGSNENARTLWLFSRTTKEGYQYSCGFFLDGDRKLSLTEYYAFCFFPTKKVTHLNFIINAPFLLTDSREGIKANDAHNVRMVELLAALAADSLIYLRDIGLEEGRMLIDDDILDYIPVNEDAFVSKNERDDISLYPFYEKIKKAFAENALLPGFNEYVDCNDAYMAMAAKLTDMFSDEQLAQLLDAENARWVLPSIGYETLYRERDGRADYIRALIVDRNGVGIKEDNDLISIITPSFIKHQTKEWLLRFYEFLLETGRRIEYCKKFPIFISSENEAVAAYDNDGNAILFIDEDGGTDGYKTISQEYLREEPVKKLAVQLTLGPPRLKDKIYTKILKKKTLNSKSDFREFLLYYIELLNNDEDVDDFLYQIAEREFILAEREDGTERKTCLAEDLYFPTAELRYYFAGCGSALFVCTEEYEQYLNKSEYRYFEEFLLKLGVQNKVRVYQYEYEKTDVDRYFKTGWQRSTRYQEWYDYRIDEDTTVLQRILENNDKKLSVILWDQLVHIFETRTPKWGEPILGGVYKYYNRTDKVQYFDGLGKWLLEDKKWIFDRSGGIHSAKEMYLRQLDADYNTTSDAARELINFLSIEDEHPEYDDLDAASRKKIELGDMLAKLGYFERSREEQDRIMETLQKMLAEKQNDKVGEEKESSTQQKSENTTEDKIFDELKDRVKQKQEKASDEKFTEDRAASDAADGCETQEEDLADSDEMTKETVDYSKEKDRVMQKCEEDIARLAQIEDAQNKAASSAPYSYAWFCALLQLEAMESGGENAKSREVSICFSKVEREEEKNRTLILKHPDKNIPAVMEELVDIPMELTFSDGQTKRLMIEAANVQSYTLRVKVKKDAFLETADFSLVTQIKIVTQNPIFLTKELQKEFAKFAEPPYHFDDGYDMRENLCENIRFIFGPPGTGKTTYLSNEVLIPIIQGNANIRVLVLTPTNKAADVLVSRIMATMGSDKSYQSWLVRYGVTGEEEIEKSGVFHGREFEIGDFKQCVVVTTMARLPYDYFIDSTGNFNYLRGIHWDYIVVDEASMIPLVQMIYMLYRKDPTQFIIAGDPFQIEPTTAVAEWKDENIYKMVQLNTFSASVATVPHPYEITLLTKQYRSIESVGEVFSQLTYGGVLEHARKNEDAKPLNIESYLEYEHLNLIRFPVSRFESIYRAKRLKKSNYQVYSALFVYEFAVYMAKTLAKENGDTRFRIGIVAPYSSQAGLIDKLLASAKLPKSIDVSSGTIHGFQGDECDIVIALFNPPPYISTNKDMFLNRQNIVNVAISRARDYLFVVMPDEQTENIENLVLINRLKRLIEKDFHNEQNTKDLERLLFGNENYIEENAFATGHQLVNVYGLPEKRYEIRSEDSALDVQVYGETRYAQDTENETGEKIL